MNISVVIEKRNGAAWLRNMYLNKITKQIYEAFQRLANAATFYMILLNLF